MSSSRLPGKVLNEACGLTMVAHLVSRLQAVGGIDEIVVATTTNPRDVAIETECKRLGVACYRGSEDDVLARVLGAAETHRADVIVEMTGDCPIADPRLIAEVLDAFLSSDADYASNGRIRSYPDGMDTQVFHRRILEDCAERTLDPRDREHVTLYIREHPEIYQLLDVVAPPALYWPQLGLTLDEADDYRLLRLLIERFFPEDPLFGLDVVIAYLRAHPEALAINQRVQRTVIE